MSPDIITKQDTTAVPVHIGFIMDGNGRWAKAKGLPRTAGHDVGMNTLEKIITACYDRKIKYITFYAFSTENWSRSKQEVDHLMLLFSKYLDKLIKKVKSKTKGIYQDTILRFIGDTSALSNSLQEKIKFLESETSDTSRFMHLNIAVNYGGRDEIVYAVNSFIEKNNGKAITKDDISLNLYTANCPDPDLIVRTAGEKRLSNFLLWQAAYSEFYSTEVAWPDFSEKELDKAITAYSLRVRKFGNIL